VKSGATEKRSDGPPPSILGQYETLRGAALGEPLPPEARSGLGLFVRKGMLAWARALVIAQDRECPTCSSSSTAMASHPHKAVVQIFAAMAWNANYRRAQ
jgi:hypothetical protein